jgi:hypothetical protein
MTKTKLNLIGLLFLLLIGSKVNGQTTHSSVCSINNLSSKNGQYFLKSIPFDNIVETPIGKTIIYSSDSTEIYKIPRYFEISDNRKELFLSNDGRKLAYIVDREFSWNDVYQNTIELYKDGLKFKEYSLSDLIDCNNETENCFLFSKEAIDSIGRFKGKRKIYLKESATDLEKHITNRAVYISNDTLIVFCKTSKVVKINLNSGELSYEKLSEFDYESVMQLDTLEFNSQKFKKPSLYGLPKLINGKDVEESLANYLDMSIYPEYSRNSDKFKRYSLNLEIIIDSTGSGTIGRMEDYGDLPEEKIKAFVSESKFQTKEIPLGIEKWRFDAWIALMNKSKKLAKEEKKQELIEERKAYERRVVADSNNGHYIPKNHEECYLEMNKLLKQKEIDAIKNLKSRSETIMYHHGFGTWLRNNWGLWSGSRLQRYLINKGINHPDSMSALILEYYYDWLNNENDGWQEFQNK